MKERLANYSGTPYAVSIQPSGEAIDFERQLVEVLLEAGWKQQSVPNAAYYILPGQPKIGLVSLTGIAIYIDLNLSDLFEATAALKAALEKEGFTVDAKRIIDGTEDVKDAIHVYVGEKPRSHEK